MGQEYRLSPLWKTDTIRRILKNEMYIGNMVQGKQTQINYKLKKPVHNKKKIGSLFQILTNLLLIKENFMQFKKL